MRGRLPRLISSMIRTCGFRRPAGRLRGEGAQQPVLDRVGHVVPAVHLHRSDLYALDKLLIAVGRVELHQPHRLVAAAGQQPGQAAGHVRLAGAGHALQDQLPFQVEQAARPPQPVVGQEGVAAEVGVGEAVARRDADPARQERQGVVLDGAGESRQQSVEGQQDLAGQLVAAQQRGVGRQFTSDLERPPRGPRPQARRVRRSRRAASAPSGRPNRQDASAPPSRSAR